MCDGDVECVIVIVRIRIRRAIYGDDDDDGTLVTCNIQAHSKPKNHEEQTQTREKQDEM